MRQVVAIGHYLQTEAWIEANEALLGTLLANTYSLREAEISSDYRSVWQI